MNKSIIRRKYETYSNWMLKHDFERIISIHQALIAHKKECLRADEVLFNESQQAKTLAQLDAICDEMNIRGI